MLLPNGKRLFVITTGPTVDQDEATIEERNFIAEATDAEDAASSFRIWHVSEYGCEFHTTGRSMTIVPLELCNGLVEI